MEKTDSFKAMLAADFNREAIFSQPVVYTAEEVNDFRETVKAGFAVMKATEWNKGGSSSLWSMKEYSEGHFSITKTLDINESNHYGKGITSRTSTSTLELTLAQRAEHMLDLKGVSIQENQKTRANGGSRTDTGQFKSCALDSLQRVMALWFARVEPQGSHKIGSEYRL